MPMKAEIKQRIAFSLLMGLVTTGIVSLTLMSINIGLGPHLWKMWLRSWATAYAVGIPVILLVGPKIQLVVYRIVKP
jgi:Protein of unknown function (DUF2798)